MSLALRDTVQKLHTYTQSPASILSVYLEVPAQKQKLLDNYNHLIIHGLTDEQQQELSNNISYIRGYLEEYEQEETDRNLAIFSGGDNLFEVAVTHFRLPSLIALDHSPYLDPLYAHIAEYQRYLIVVADREKAKFFTIHLGELEDQSELFEEHVPQKMKGRNFEEREDKIDRHIQDHLHRHFNHLAEELKVFLKDKPVTAVIVGGHKEIIHTIENHLPKSLREKVIGKFTAEPDAPFNGLLQQSKEILKIIDEKTRPTTPAAVAL